MGLITYWKRQHTCFLCFAWCVLLVGCLSAAAGAFVGGSYGAGAVGALGATAYFFGFIFGISEGDRQ